MINTIDIKVVGQGLHEFTGQVAQLIQDVNISEGLCTLYIQHTSASLLIQENADRSVQQDLESWLNRLVPEGDDIYTHTIEGPDDMPAHIKSAITATSLSIPFADSKLMLGTWQGIYLWEHRRYSGMRHCAVHIGI